ncbi:MAG: hypothetical protein L6W00_19830 [Lentisphaeria bacterium]|nr:MAG: hypothetical protein L6W00_19830 [Lentisphaeria bacterium]
MAELPGAEGGAVAADQPPGRDDAAADAGAHRKIDEIGASAPGAEEPLGQCAAVGVILETAVDAELVLEVTENRHIPPQRIVGGRREDAVDRVGGERRGDAERSDVRHFQPGLFDQFPRHADHFRENILRTGVDVFNPALAEKFAVAGSETDADFGSADVETENEFLLGHVFLRN